MCINENVSWVTLAVGTLFNLGVCILLWRTVREWPLAVTIAAWWQFGLMMQLPEAMVWRTGGDGAWERVAFSLNVTQPHAAVAGGMVVWWLTRGADSTWGWGEAMQRRLFRRFPRVLALLGTLRWGIPAAALMLYSLLVAVELPGCAFGMVKLDCPHLSLAWWEGCLAGAPLAMYLAVSALSFTLLPLGWGGVNLAIWGATLAVSEEVYECSKGSMWCWMVAFANVVVAAAALVFERLDYPRRREPSIITGGWWVEE